MGGTPSNVPHISLYSYFPHTASYYYIFLHIPSYFPHVSSDFLKSHRRGGRGEEVMRRFQVPPPPGLFFSSPTQDNPQNLSKSLQVSISRGIRPRVKFYEGGGGGVHRDMKHVNIQIYSTSHPPQDFYVIKR